MKIIDLSNKTGEQEIILDEEGMELRIVGAFQTRGNESLELKVKIIHRAPHTSAQTVFRGVAWDNSSLKIYGTIIIEKTAQQTISFLKENVLLMSPKARAEAVPNLEILANDVKCSHAATISNIPQEHLFYMMSRGLTQKAAEKLIVEGFLDIQSKN